MDNRLSSLRSWIQSTTLLVIFGSFTILIAAGHVLLKSEAMAVHESLASRLRRELALGTLELPLHSPLGFRAKLIKNTKSTARKFTELDDRVWIESVSSLPEVGAGSSLLIVQDVTEIEMHHQELLELFLIVACLTVLFSALLLRVVLWRGLTLPLSGLIKEMDVLEADSLGKNILDPELQPVEFKTIVHSFNHLQERLASSWRRERCFVDGVAHELRTPITVLSTNSQRLLSDVSDESKSTVQLLISESQRLGDLLSVMLDFARVDAGRIVLSLNLFDPELLCVDAFERLQCLSPDRIRLCEPPDKVFPTILVDDQRFHQCMAALVENALRYTHGYVDLSLTIANDHVVFHVIDSGSGIPEGEREFVVTRFARGSTSIGTRGSGIGLAVVHEFMLLMGGHLVICDSLQGGADIRLMFNF